MLYRFATVGIVAFWIVMMAMLVRLEMHPEATDILDVPVSYVERIMFKHGQQSLLSVRQGEKPIGTISVHPSITGSDARMLDCSGSLSLQMPATAQQRFNFHAVLDMDKTLRVQDFHLDVNLQQPRCQVSVKGDVARKTLEYEMRDGDHLINSQTLPWDAGALGPAVLQSLGLPGSAMPFTPSGPVVAPIGISPPAVTARETQITLHGEKVEVYEVIVSEGTAQMAEFYVTQLGQVVLAKTSFGYTISMEDYQ